MKPFTTGIRSESVEDRNGFALLELLAVTLTVAILLVVLAPAWAQSGSKSHSARCLSNMRQVMGAFLMYTHDYHDLFPPNPDDGNMTIGHNWCLGQAGVGGGQQFNPDILTDPGRCLISPYLNGDASVFRCTLDTRTGRYQGTNAALLGTTVPAARTISSSQAVGNVCAAYKAHTGHSGKPTLPVDGPWLTGTYGGNTSANGPWRTYGKSSSMILPNPAGLWIVMEEEPLSINDAGMGVSMSRSAWIDFPGTLHNLAGVISFGDGHVELHKWINPAMRLTAPPGLISLRSNDPDWLWLTARTSADFR